MPRQAKRTRNLECRGNENVFLARFSFWPTWNLCSRTLVVRVNGRANDNDNDRVTHWDIIWLHLVDVYDTLAQNVTTDPRMVLLFLLQNALNFLWRRTPILRCVAITISGAVWLLVLLLVRNCSFIFSNRRSLFGFIVSTNRSFQRSVFHCCLYVHTSAYHCHALSISLATVATVRLLWYHGSSLAMHICAIRFCCVPPRYTSSNKVDCIKNNRM